VIHLSKKVVELKLTLHFQGDYIPVEDCERYVENWISMGLEDRDDLRDWYIEVLSVNETDGDA